MHGVISLTDHDWFQFLSRQQGLDEVNFWRPRDLQRPNLEPGTPFIFRLRKPFGGKVVGYGLFARHSVLPAWLAWEAFGVANGAATFAEMRARLERLRRDPAAFSSPGDYPIGCVMLSAPVFLPEERWLDSPAEWSDNIVQGKGYDLAVGEGARVWRELLERTGGMALPSPSAVVAGGPAPAYGTPRLVSPRLGQGTFRVAVADAYQRACAVTSEHSLPVLEAAHIRPYAQDGPHEVANGLLLRTDIHRLFDKGYVTVSPDDLCFQVSDRLRQDYSNGRTYYALHGKPLTLPNSTADRPARQYLEWHAREVYRG